MSRPHLSFALDNPLVGSDFFQGHRTARTQLLRADANLRSQSELGAVGKRGGGIPIDAGGIDMRLELAGGLLVLRDDGLAVPGAVTVDVLQCLVERRDGLEACCR